MARPTSISCWTMTMRTTQRTADQVSVISLDGRMTRNDGFGAVKTAVTDLLAQGHTQLLVDMGGVSYMDSTGVGELVSAFITTRNHHGSLKLLNPSHRLRELFEVAKLETVFEMFDDEAEALRSF
jgi:anti-sigma B factor antagonist